MTPLIDVVVKVGGGLLQSPDSLDRTLASLDRFAAHARLLIVPGGGPFADTVRDLDRRIGLDDDTAHWMAILGMDQYAYVLAARLRSLLLVNDRAGISEAIRLKRLPVLAPYVWLRRDDPLPHSWDVTSDSIAAWLAAETGAPRLLLVKPADAQDPLVDAEFSRRLVSRVSATIVRAGMPLDTTLEGWRHEVR